MMWWTNSGWGTGEWFAMGSMMLIFWGAVLGGAFWVARRGVASPRTGTRSHATEGADALLAQRFARGEIDEAQFTRARALLHATDAS